jgi:hypothetical protein
MKGEEGRERGARRTARMKHPFLKVLSLVGHFIVKQLKFSRRLIR